MVCNYTDNIKFNKFTKRNTRRIDCLHKINIIRTRHHNMGVANTKLLNLYWLFYFINETAGIVTIISSMLGKEGLSCDYLIKQVHVGEERVKSHKRHQM